MCGIAGILDPDGGAIDPALLQRMADALAHRGPDDQGIHVEPGLGLAHRRLAVIDLVTGAQPMATAGGERRIVFNGEIFNHVELRDRMRARGRSFATTSDTEVLLQLHAELGDAMLAELNGQFAFALWDRPRRRLLLARDRFGERPLYHCRIGRRLAFASEIKALFALPEVRRELDRAGLAETLTFWTPVAPRTAFAGIEQLPPGHALVVEDGRARSSAWFELASIWRIDPTWTAERALAALRERLDRSVELRLRADVPVGCYLSGGVDSALTTALAARRVGARLQAFSIGFEDASLDESEAQQQTAAALRIERNALRLPSAAPEPFAVAVRHAEQPLLRTAPAPMARLAAHVRAHGVKVVLTGEGADEFFGGYDLFKEQKLRRFAARDPRSPRRRDLLHELYPYLPRLQSQPAAMRAAFFAASDQDLADPFFSHRLRWRTGAALRTLLADDPPDFDPVAELADRLPPEFGRWDPLTRAQHLEAAILLPGYLLGAQGDRMAMAHGVEARFPFLDPDLVAFAGSLPPRLRLHGTTEKWLLRRLARDLLPDAITLRPKRPYRAPDVTAFFTAGGEPLAGWVADLLAPDAIRRAGLFDAAAVGRLVAKLRAQPAQAGTKDSMALVAVLSAQLLHSQFVARQPVA